MADNGDILTLTPDSLWPVRVGRSGFMYNGYPENDAHVVSEIDYDTAILN